jgi:hydroxypyruvate isomerase
MPTFAANISMMYTEHSFMDRFAAAAKDGFTAVEYLFPYEFDKHDLAKQLADNGLTQALFNAPPGDWDNGEKGMACLPGREADFKRSVDTALDYARVIGNDRLHIMAGLAPAAVGDASIRRRHQATYVSNLAYAAELAGREGITVVIEPINTRDIPGFFLNRQDHAHEIVELVGSPHLKVQMDLYHCQIVEGDLAVKLKTYLPGGNVGHIQIAGVPDRHEPDAGEVSYPYLYSLIDALGYRGYIGCEYRPAKGTTEGLGWMKAALAA